MLDYNYTEDMLNDFHNFNFSLYKLKKYYDYCLQQNKSFAICLAEIENLKTYKYMFGYKYGHLLLNTAFKRVQDCINNDGCVFMSNGDVLLIALYKIKNKNDAEDLLKRIEANFSDLVEIEGQKIKLTIKIGISICTPPFNELENVLKNADIALDYAKKSCLCNNKFFSFHMYEEIIRKGKLEIDILKAIRNNEFLLYFQPQINVATMSVYGVEALLRWNHREYGILSPLHFIDLVEQNGMINDIGKFVLSEACKQLKIYVELGYENLNLSVNISETQLEDETFLLFVFEVLKETGVNPQSLTFEIVERILVDSSERVISTLSELRSKGVKIYIDDFGTKYSSLNYLYTFPVDGIKLDKSFIDEIVDFKKSLIITKSIVTLAKELNIEVVAEGVESAEQLNLLMAMECNKIQGFIFEKPVASNELVNFLNRFHLRKII